jgi:cytochrome c peroxidase
MPKSLRPFFALCFVALSAGALHAAENTEVNKALLSLFAPLPKCVECADNPVTPEKVDLGRKLFFDPRFSKSQTISCNSCHGLDHFGVDGQPTSEGFQGQHGGRNAPTVLNAALHLAQFWDGRAASVEEQAKGPVLNPVEMAMDDAPHVLKVINSIDQYKELFAKAFPGEKDPVTYDNFGKAIGAFERELLTPCRWDDFLNGQDQALTPAEKAGFNKFVTTGCVSCHNGVGVGGAMYQKLGVMKPWPGLKDDGRGGITKNDGEKGFFKVPSLRNIEKTGPYLHDGSIKDLPTMVQKMAEHQLGKTLSTEDVDSIVSFLKSLTGKLPDGLATPPQLPPSGPETPKPVAG